MLLFVNSQNDVGRKQKGISKFLTILTWQKKNLLIPEINEEATRCWASLTVLHIAFAFLFFAKIYKNTSSTVLHIGLAFLETWQIPERLSIYASPFVTWQTSMCRDSRARPWLPRAIGNSSLLPVCFKVLIWLDRKDYGRDPSSLMPVCCLFVADLLSPRSAAGGR